MLMRPVHRVLLKLVYLRLVIKYEKTEKAGRSMVIPGGRMMSEGSNTTNCSDRDFS